VVSGIGFPGKIENYYTTLPEEEFDSKKKESLG
jgi:hypothetical protein